MQLVNVVLSGKFWKPVNVYCIPKVVYNPRKFSGAVCEHRSCTFLIFPNGSFVCLGAKEPAIAKRSVLALASQLGNSVKECCVKNMVMSHRLPFGVDLKNLYEGLRQLTCSVTYENELFNGLVWKEMGGTVRIFHTGSFFVTGLRKKENLIEVCRRVIHECEKYKK